MRLRDQLTAFVKFVVDQDSGALLEDEEIAEELIDEFVKKQPKSTTASGRYPSLRPNRANKPKSLPRRSSRWEDFVDECEDLLTDIGEISDKCQAKDSWSDQTQNMQTWARENEHVTEPMLDAFNNIAEGVGKWMR